MTQPNMSLGNPNNIAINLIQETPFEHKPLNVRMAKTVDGQKSVIIQTYLQDFDVLNRNKKIYQIQDMKNSVNNPKGFIQEGLKHFSLVGEAGHPVLDNTNQQKAIERQMSICHSRISHRINKLEFVGNKLLGEIETLLTDRGIDLYNLILQKLEPAFSYRGLGPVERTSKGLLVKGPLRSRTWDWVFNPSHELAYKINTKNVLSESFDLDYYNKQREHTEYLPLSECQMLDYIVDKDTNVKNLIEELHLEYNHIKILNKGKLVDMKLSESENIIIKLDDYVSNEISGYIKSIDVERFKNETTK